MAMKHPQPPLHTTKLLRRATFNRLFMAVYTVALLALFYHHMHMHAQSTNGLGLGPGPLPLVFSLIFLLSDLILGFGWAISQAYHIRPIRRHEFPENLVKSVSELPAVDIFICTADPFKEPPMGTVNTAISAMTYDYSPEKLSIYVSDDGGSKLTLFAFIEAAKFARHWLPFCRDYHVIDTCPEAYFNTSSHLTSTSSPLADKLKIMYENMKMRVEMVVENGKIIEEYVDDQHMRNALAKWTPAFSRQNHPAIIQVLLTSNGDKDINGQSMPNLIYVSREKCSTQPHHFKAGALNALLRVSATMTNAPIVLTLDCDTYSNDPQTVKRALCYFCDPLTRPTLAYVQFPQIFRGLNKGDIYFCENKRLYQINPMGMDGLLGPNNVGTNCFFQRRAFFGSPSFFVKPEPHELSPDYTVGKPIGSPDVLKLAHHVAACNFEEKTDWGSKLGYRYGSLVEDYYTGYRMKCEGWRSIFAHPDRPAFLGDSPITLIDLLGQCKRWMVGLLEVLCSKYSTITFGVRKMGLLMGFAYTHCAYWPILSIPLTFYAFIPQLALLNGVSIFPKVTDPCFVLYIFLFIGVYAKDLLDFLLERGTFERWWNSQRMWMICGLSSFLFGTIKYILGVLGVTARGFDVTNKQQDDELSKRYDQGIYEFGVTSPMFVPLTMAAIINLVSFVVGLIGMFTKGIAHLDVLVLQILLSGFGVVNSWPLYEAMAFRSDRGRMPSKVIFVAGLMVSILCIVGHSIF